MDYYYVQVNHKYFIVNFYKWNFTIYKCHANDLQVITSALSVLRSVRMSLFSNFNSNIRI
jgi:hypothetical protein